MLFQPGQKANIHGPVGKINFLPSVVRNEINRRIEDNQTSKDIAAWLNAQEEVRKILAERWGGQPLSKDAIDRWRQKGYKEWRRKREELDNLKELAEYALKLGQAAGGSVADGSAAIAGGRIMSILETASDEDIFKIIHAISELRAGDFTKTRLEQNDKKLAQNKEKLAQNTQRLAQYEQKLELERKRFQRQTAELYFEWYDNKKAREIVEGRGSNAEKIELLGREIFGDHW
jgi:hypothetical protein